jgi:chromosome segregation ATPase
MLLRISLIVAILASLGSFYFAHTRVRHRITALARQRDSAQVAQRVAEDAQRRAEKDRQQAREGLDEASKQLADKTTALESTAAKLAEQVKRANEAAENLTKVTGERNAAQEALAVWNQISWMPEQIRGFQQDLAKASEQRDTFAKENKTLLRQYSELNHRLKSLIGPEEEVQMQPGLTGKVVAVDPKYEFVVLNIGGEQGVVKDGKLLVSRGGKLVSKLRVAKVEPNHCIANIIRDFGSDVIEGDRVVY